MSKKYSKQQLLEALKSGYDSKTTGKKFNVPASTIRRHRRNHSLKADGGRQTYLTSDEEAYFVSILQLLPDFGLNVSSETTLQLANDYCQSLGLSHHPGEKWLRLFRKKHTNDIIWKREQRMERFRAEALKGKCNWVIVNSNRRHTLESGGGTGKNYFIVLIAINVDSFVLIPFVIYGGQHLMNSWCCGEPPGTVYGITDKTIVDDDIPLSLYAASYVDLQPYPMDLAAEPTIPKNTYDAL
ncbi:unnamed protein product [Rotaria sp. Silwood2]|nr:unnamed protein product [Rotaria sp. Silwood2]CAF2800125.1 unnamed protein product [Rotaria sp. Silwood2]CAF3081436.1 unnamed protein product [Rotaria sp. Silwood2]CAF4192929.1 unnamed protein product [Rotaria sp. Silwood2]CAF4307275.1 unnamed protein product [Rotaria sp. Silwood2]